MPSVAYVLLGDNFDQWRIKTNEIIDQSDLRIRSDGGAGSSIALTSFLTIGDYLTVAGVTTLNGDLLVKNNAGTGNLLFVDGLNDTVTSQNLSVSNNIQVGTTLGVNGGVTFNDDFTVKNAGGVGNLVYVDGSGDTVTLQNLTVTTNASITGDLTITGSLVVNGTTTTLNTATLSVADNIITLNSDFVVGAPIANAGIEVLRGDLATVSIRWNETSDKWEVTEDGVTYYNVLDFSDIGVDGGVEEYVLRNWNASVDPTVNDDSSAGYSTGSDWYNTAGATVKVFRCIDATIGAAVWVESANISDLGTLAFKNHSDPMTLTSSFTSDTLTYTRATAITGADLNTIVTSGFYDGQTFINAPTALGTGWGYVEVIRHSAGVGYCKQVVTSLASSTPRQWVRNLNNFIWGSWIEIYNSGSDGAGSGLDADLFDGLDSSVFGQLSTVNTWTNTNTFTNAVTITLSDAGALSLNSASVGSNVGIDFLDNNIEKWLFYKNTTNDIILQRRDTTSGNLDIINVNHTTGVTTFGADIVATGHTVSTDFVSFTNVEASGFPLVTGTVGYDASQGIQVYRTTTIGDATVEGVYTVLDASNIESGSNIAISGNTENNSGTIPVTFSVVDAPTFSGKITSTAGSASAVLLQAPLASNTGISFDTDTVSRWLVYRTSTSENFIISRRDTILGNASTIILDHATGSVALFYGGVSTFETTDTGATLTGTLNATVGLTVNGNVTYHTANLTKAVIDALGVDADTLDNINSTGFLNSSNTATGDMSTTGYIAAGRGSGGVALTVNDGSGNANVTFNHASGTPEQDGNSARITVNTDSSTSVSMLFKMVSGDLVATPQSHVTVLSLSEGAASVTGSVSATGDVSGASMTVNTFPVESSICKVWLTLDTFLFSEFDSQGVQSLTDNAIGDFTITFSSAFNNAGYAVSGSGVAAPTTTGAATICVRSTTNADLPTLKTTTQVRMITPTGSGQADNKYCSVMIHGD